jgi:hypothetical protein
MDYNHQSPHGTPSSEEPEMGLGGGDDGTEIFETTYQVKELL